jgi:hypothetical protein
VRDTPGDKHYLITQRGLDELGRASGGAVREGQAKLFEDWIKEEPGVGEGKW